jgi:hypothetical protein
VVWCVLWFVCRGCRQPSSSCGLAVDSDMYRSAAPVGGRRSSGRGVWCVVLSFEAETKDAQLKDGGWRLNVL